MLVIIFRLTLLCRWSRRHMVVERGEEEQEQKEQLEQEEQG